MNKIACCALIFITIVACSTVPKSYTEIDKSVLSAKIDDIFSDTLFNHAHWGALITSLDDGAVIYSKNSERMFMPASNEKIPTAAASLVKLGPEFKFRTILAYSGSIADSTLHGDLVIIGDGDPTLSDRIYEKPTTVFEDWADSLISLRINKIEGNIIGDDNKFDDVHIGYGWPHSGLDYWYSAEFGALQLNENYVDLQITPPLTVNDTIKITPDIVSNYYSLINEIELVDTGRTRLDVSSTFGTNDFLMKGNLVYGTKPFERSPTITNPTKFYVTVLKEVFEEKGITIAGTPLDCDEIIDYPDSVNISDTLIVHESMELNKILKVLMKKSQNLYAETMVRTLGYNFGELGSFKEGKKVVEDILIEFGVDSGSYSFMDGSGLSRYNFISPKQIVKILAGMKQNIYWNFWYDTFPIAGIDGTLKWRMKGTKAEKNVRAKTGTISNVRGLSGYATSSNGEEFVFSFLINGHLRTSRETELVTDKVLELLTEFPIVSIKFFE